MNPAVIYIFGGTGDLANKKLFPAFFALFRQEELPEFFQLIVIGRRELRTDQLRQHLFELLQPVSKQMGDSPNLLKQFLQQCYYHQMHFDQSHGYQELKLLRDTLVEGTGLSFESMMQIAYLAIGPEYFESVVTQLSAYDILSKGHPLHRIVIEKPFGRDLESARAINLVLQKILSEDQIFRMDHYLGKSMIQNLMVLRFANAIFEPTWNKQYIDHIQLTVTETIGVGDRSGYYDQSGALRDMVQSHLLQMLALIAMEPPEAIGYQSLCSEKVRVIESLRIEDLKTDLVLGQYTAGSGKVGYLEEKGIRPESQTETFVALRVFIDNERWAGIPFYIRTGKALSNKQAEITIVYKNELSFMRFGEAKQNLLKVRIQPEEGTSIHFNLIEPGNAQNMILREMDFCQSCLLMDGSPEAYEKLIYDVLEGDHTLYTRWDEVESSWRFVDPILKWIEHQSPGLQYYAYGSKGPEAGQRLIAPRQWL